MSNGPTFRLQFALDPLRDLDEFALLACQSYNLGNASDWFGCFRGGIYAVHQRVYGIQRHYEDVHAWLPAPRIFGDVEHHLADLLFNLDSAMECLIYGLNALGFAAFPEEFLDVTDRRSLKGVNPGNMIGSKPLPGYDRVFPNLKKHWMANAGLVGIIVEQHDVSKHRSVIFSGGKMRDDPPPDYFERLKIADDPIARATNSPMAEIILGPDPKAPPVERLPTPRSEQILLEGIVPSFCDFFNEAVTLANVDARSNITLAHSRLREDA